MIECIVGSNIDAAAAGYFAWGSVFGIILTGAIRQWGKLIISEKENGD